MKIKCAVWYDPRRDIIALSSQRARTCNVEYFYPKETGILWQYFTSTPCILQSMGWHFIGNL